MYSPPAPETVIPQAKDRDLEMTFYQHPQGFLAFHQG